MRFFASHVRWLLLLIAVIFALPLVTFITQRPQEYRQHAATSFVTRNGKQLLLNSQPFLFIGVNRWNLLTTANPSLGCGEAWSQPQLDAYFAEMKSINITVVRIAAQQAFTASGTNFTEMDYLLSLAQKYNIFIIPTLGSFGAECSHGGYKYDTWYQSGYLSPYDEYPISYKNYVNLVVSRYKNNPYILMWQLMNEAESKTTNNVSDPQALYNFANDMSAYIKSLDPNHLVNLGTIGGGQPGTEGTNYQNLYSIPTIDILEVHDYVNETTALPSFVANDLTVAAALNKPVFIGEAGIRNDCTATCFSLSQRAGLFQAKMNAFFGQNGNGYLIWSYRDNYDNPSSPDVYQFTLEDPLAQVVKSESISRGGGTTFALTICPHGLGNCGDNANPNSSGNTNPMHPQVNVTLTILNANNQPVTTGQGSVTYTTSAKNFQGTASVNTLSAGSYLVQIKLPGFLPKQFPGIITIPSSSPDITLPQISLVNGDINNDNQIDLLDYNLLINCFGSKAGTAGCQNKTASDINDDSNVDGIDYNLFLRELSVQRGG